MEENDRLWRERLDRELRQLQVMQQEEVQRLRIQIANDRESGLKEIRDDLQQRIDRAERQRKRLMMHSNQCHIQ